MAAEQEGRRAPFVVEWREGFKVNIAQVDEEHQRLFALIKALNLQSVDKTVEELLDYVVTHFSNEQALMESAGYPVFPQHLKLHEAFGATVAEFLSGGDQWSEERVQELRRFLNKWLIGHILTHDMRFGNWYREHGAQGPARVQGSKEQKGFLARLFRKR